ncbi:MAG: hypothetical protein U9O94_01945 [Nanoarchaeota archaeon]|nr:hypothetical protein [Nanoarchaeota archaeon]
MKVTKEQAGSPNCYTCVAYPGHNKKCPRINRTVTCNAPICWKYTPSYYIGFIPGYD